ncbi:MAG: efflux RND transporter periplasmic adaptor subunit [Phycisphaerales bacterium]|nr:efflux RND transporter periplasmic adaptor subunit [Phycisphaerales bacterium]
MVAPSPERAGRSDSRRLLAVLGNSALGLAFLAAVVVLLLWLAGSFEPKIGGPVHAGPSASLPPAGDRPRVEVVSIAVPLVETAVGSIEAVHELTVASKLLARIETMNVTAGAAIRSGDVIATLDSEDLQARLEQSQAAVSSARARRDQAQREFDRLEEVFASGAANQLELNRAQTALESAQGDLLGAEQAQREAETILAYATIRSPISGVVIDKLVEQGDTVAPGQPMVTLYDPTRMQLVASVRESLTQRLKVGEPVDVQVESLDLQCTGIISEIVPQAAPGSRSFLVKVTGPCPEGVYSGMFGRLLIPLEDEQVLVVPAEAVRRVGQIELVDVVIDDHLQRRAVRTGRAMPGDALEVLSGLRAGEVVALADRGPGS